VKEYLQRLASSARSGETMIHPVVGSLYSGSKYESAPRPFEEEQVTWISPEPRTQSAQLREVPIHESNVKPEPDFAAAKPKAAAVTQSEVEEPGVEAASVSGEAGPATEPPGPRAKQEPVEAREPHLMPAKEAQPKEIYRPLIVKSVVEKPGSQGIMSRGSQPVRAGKAARPKPQDPAGTGEREHERDEIQVHIGRIEVTAATQPPAPRPAKPVRKALNLDEYLRRGRA